MKEIFSLLCTHHSSDMTTWFDIVNANDFTLREAINYIVEMAKPEMCKARFSTNMGEFGRVSCKNDVKEYFICRYDDHSVEFDEGIDQFLDKKFSSGLANGGWGNMDYTFILSKGE